MTDNPYAPPTARVDDAVRDPEQFAEPLNGIPFYLAIKGRISRKSFWLRGVLPIFVITFIMGLIGGMLRMSWLIPVSGLVAIWPTIALMSRRLHDANLSAGLSLVWVGALFAVGALVANGMTPLYGTLLSYAIQTVIGLLPGTFGPNKYGLPELRAD